MNVLLDRRISIQRKVAAQDSKFGSDASTWVELANVWAEVRDAVPSRAESTREGLEQARNQTRVRIRYRDDLDSSMRIVHGNQVMEIVGGPAELGRRQWTEFMCERVSTQGDT